MLTLISLSLSPGTSTRTTTSFLRSTMSTAGAHPRNSPVAPGQGQSRTNRSKRSSTRSASAISVHLLFGDASCVSVSSYSKPVRPSAVLTPRIRVLHELLGAAVPVPQSQSCFGPAARRGRAPGAAPVLACAHDLDRGPFGRRRPRAPERVLRVGEQRRENRRHAREITAHARERNTGIWRGGCSAGGHEAR